MALTRYLLVALVLFSSHAMAATYDLRKNLPPGCSQQGNNPAQCPNGLTLGWNDVLVFDKISEVNVTGNVQLQNAQVFIGASTPLTINASGSIQSNSGMNLYGNLNATGSITLGYANQVEGNITSQNQITLADSVNVIGALSAPQLSLTSNNSVTGTLTADQANIGSNSDINGDIFVDNDLTLQSGGSITGSINAGDFNTNSPVDLSGPINVINDFFLASGSNVDGDITAGAVTLASSNSLVQGNISASGDVIIGSSTTVDGNVAGSFIRLISSNASITGNATAAGNIVIEWAGQIGGDATAVNITNNAGSTSSVAGTAYCETSDGSNPLSCQTGSGGGGGATQCDALNNLADYGFVGEMQFEYGNNSEINGTDITDPNNTNGNTPTPTGVVEDATVTFPPLTPNAFPAFSGGSSQTNPSGLAPGTYTTIALSGNNASASLAGGGTYFIDAITFGPQTQTLILGPGDYFVRSINMNNDSSIEINPTGQVRIFIEDALTGGNNLFFNSNGAVQNLVINLYAGAEFEIGNFNQASSTYTFNGILYAPYSDNTIEFGNNTNLQGAVLTAGTLDIGNNTEINYSDAVQDAVREGFGCDTEVTDIHHYRIQHPLSVVSCLAAPVRVIACLDASCASRYTDTASVTLASSANASSFENGGALSFTGGEGLLGLSYVDGGTTTISLNNAAPAALNATECYDSAGSTATNCAIEFSTAGLIFTAADGISPIPPSFAGNNFNAAVRAVETNTQTGACEARLTGAQTLELAASCRNPLTCQAGQSFAANGNPVPLNDAAAILIYNAIPVTFDSNGSAPLTLNYSDVGAMRLHGQVGLSESPNNTEPTINDPSVTLSGTSLNDFVVKPHTLSVTAVDAADQPVSATTNGGAAFASAGANFSLVVSSRNANGDPTPNFGREVPNSEVQTSYVQTIYPTNASAPATDYIGDQGFVLDPNRLGSLRTDSARWLDVGTIEVAPALSNNSYLGAGDVAVKQNTTVGRFAPFRFAIDSSAVTNSCVPGDYSYMSEPALNVIYQLYAVDSDGNVTENYSAADYVGTAQVDIVAANLSPADNSSDRFADRLINLPTQQSWSAGVLNFTTGSAGFARHPDGIIDGPFASLQLGIQVTSEIDNRNFSASDLDLSTVSGDAASLNGMLQLRYGRFVIENTYGPETEDLSVPLRAEFFDGSRFITHVADSCTTAQVSALAVLSDPASLSPSATGSDTPLVDGVVPFNALRWQATGTGNVGEFIYEYDAPAWLEFNWLDDSGSSYQDPRGIAGFGQYRGNNRVLFWKELQ